MPINFCKVVKNDILFVRESLDMTQAEFGALTGYTGANISHWECGRRIPLASTYLRLLSYGAWRKGVSRPTEAVLD